MCWWIGVWAAHHDRIWRHIWIHVCSGILVTERNAYMRRVHRGSYRDVMRKSGNRWHSRWRRNGVMDHRCVQCWRRTWFRTDILLLRTVKSRRYTKHTFWSSSLSSHLPRLRHTPDLLLVFDESSLLASPSWFHSMCVHWVPPFDGRVAPQHRKVAPEQPSTRQEQYSGSQEKNKVKHFPWAVRLLVLISEPCRESYQGHHPSLTRQEARAPGNWKGLVKDVQLWGTANRRGVQMHPNVQNKFVRR